MTDPEPTERCETCRSTMIHCCGQVYNPSPLGSFIHVQELHTEIAALREQVHSDQARVIQAEVVANEAEAELAALRAALVELTEAASGWYRAQAITAMHPTLANESAEGPWELRCTTAIQAARRALKEAGP